MSFLNFDFHSPNQDGTTPLHIAAEVDGRNIARLLLEAGASTMETDIVLDWSNEDNVQHKRTPSDVSTSRVMRALLASVIL